jgi:hypothetical protein
MKAAAGDGEVAQQRTREENYEEKEENDKEKSACLPFDSPFLPVPSVCLITARIRSEISCSQDVVTSGQTTDRICFT